MPIAAYDSAFARDGFSGLCRAHAQMSPGPDDEPDYWDELLRYPSFVLLDCVKA